MSYSRRSFLSAAAMCLPGISLANNQTARGPICVFAKPLQWLSFEQLSQFLVDHQFDGIEATIRKGGQIEPADAAERIPQLVETLKSNERDVTLFASDISSIDQPHAEATLRAASQAGIRYYRMAYYRYDIDKPILPQLDQFTKQVEQLVKVNKELNMTALYQNHAGTRIVGAGLWDLYRLLAEQPTSQVAAAFDIRHATVEATQCWPIHWEILQPNVGAIYLKDFHWNGSKPENVPLGTGVVDHRFYKMLRAPELSSLPISLHMEYINHRKPELIEQSKAAIGADRQMLNKLIGV